MAGEKDSANGDPLSHWPEKGLPLRNALIRLAGQAAYDAYQAALTQRLPPEVRWWQWPPREVCQALFEPLLTLWNNDEIYATGRPEDSLRRVPVPSPADGGWVLWVRDWEFAVIEDPRKDGALIYGLRFWPKKSRPKPEAPAEPQSQPLARGNKEWLRRAVLDGNILPDVPPGPRKHGQQKPYLQKLTPR